MYYDIETRVLKEAEYILKERATVRKTSEKFGVSKSTVHYDLTKRLKELDADGYEKVRKILFINLSERHIRGGMATRDKFKRKDNQADKAENTGKKKSVRR
ncbi:MAG: sporulation transcriptional regulator SpoIIID [Clostridia bacterium]|nr:sporulation transcriptional regulator SpoIIID [Clostridia bacterium]